MSTNIVIPNLTVIVTDPFYLIWKLTRGLKASGWLYKASSDGINTKETTGSCIQDKWGPGTIVPNHISFGNQGTTGSLSATTNSNFVTLTALSGMTDNSVGHSITISGATNSANNGTFTIVTRTSASAVTIFNPLAVTETVTNGITWSERVSGSGTITWSSVSNGREQTISGLSGMTPVTLTSGTYGSASHYIKLEGASNGNNNGIFQILYYINSTIVVVNNASGISETNPGYWTELDPIGETYPNNFGGSSTALAWILFQGPSTLKIPINSASNGTFRSGEIVTQSVTGAQGELITYFWEPSLSVGWLGVMPRVFGTGSGVKGWSTGSTTITGGTSGATVTTGSSTPSEFVREFIIQKGTSSNPQTLGTMAFQVVDGYMEAKQRFSYLATQSGCTNVVPPGSSAFGNSNSFPSAGSYVVKGNIASQYANYPTYWFINATIPVYGPSHIILTNPDFNSSNSADGSFIVALGTPSQTPGAHVGFAFQRVDNTEDGDIDPYVWYEHVNNPWIYGAYEGERRWDDSYSIISAGVPVTNLLDNFAVSNIAPKENLSFKGTCRRGTLGFLPPVYDHFQNFKLGYLGTLTGDRLLANYIYNNDAIATSISLSPPKIAEPMWVITEQIMAGRMVYGYQITNVSSNFPADRMRKGTLRWMFMVAGGSGGDLYNNKQFIQLSSGPITAGTIYNGCMVAGPWDGYTIPFA